MSKTHQETCEHEFVGYTICCYCGYCKNAQGEIVDPYVAHNKKALADEFSKWYFAIKEEHGTPPLAVQIFHWFNQRTHVNISEHNEEVARLEKIIAIKESERQEWANLVIKKQTIIHSIHDYLFLGEFPRAYALARQTVGANEVDPSSPIQSETEVSEG